ncbi:transcription factor HES-7.1-like [Engraulis encrasicolus]|uniref:transcription factor HES-7.1-like n=1 Tax=Engraulis encrasicolus TaxID=184585 RepID=UPI002FD3138C
MERPEPKKFRRIAKPVMEKRRRDRINHSLETLRILLSGNNEKLRSPKVEKAEILDSVVNFLRAEHAQLQARRKRAREEVDQEQDEEEGNMSPPHKQMYSDGVTACLLTVSHFMSSKNQELECAPEQKASYSPHHSSTSTGNSYKYPATMTMPLYDRRTLTAKQQSRQSSLATCLTTSTVPYGQQAGYLATTNMAASHRPALVVSSDCVWRPWPQ